MKMRPVTSRELWDVLDKASVRYAALAALGAGTGARISELLMLRRFDLLDPAGRPRKPIRVPKLKARAAGRHRELELLPELWPYVLRLLRKEELNGNDRPDALVFQGHLGQPLQRQTVWRYFRDLLGPGHGTHWMRKTFACRLYDELCRERGIRSGTSDFAVAKNVQTALGHRHLDSTLAYLQIDEMNISEAIRRMYAKEQ